MAYGTMGGFGQPQTQGAIFTRYVLFKEMLADAIDRPRWLLRGQWGASKPALRIESRFDGSLLDALASAGHDIDAVGRALFGYDGPRRRGCATFQWDLRGRPRPTGGWRSGRGLNLTPRSSWQRGGSIEVDTKSGEFTEFRIVLPRAGVSLIKSGERS